MKQPDGTLDIEKLYAVAVNRWSRELQKQIRQEVLPLVRRLIMCVGDGSYLSRVDDIAPTNRLLNYMDTSLTAHEFADYARREILRACERTENMRATG